MGTGYGLRFSAEIYGSKREKTAFHENLQEACFALPEVFRSLWELAGEGNLGILCSSSLSGWPFFSERPRRRARVFAAPPAT